MKMRKKRVGKINVEILGGFFLRSTGVRKNFMMVY